MQSGLDFDMWKNMCMFITIINKLINNTHHI